MDHLIKLSLEQEFSLRCFTDEVEQMSREQAQEFLLMLHQQMMIRDITYQQLLKHEWRLD